MNTQSFFINLKAGILICFLVITSSTTAQIAVSNPEAIARLKNGTTYFALQDTGSAAARDFKAVILKHWTYSKPVFILYQDMYNYLSADVSFFSLSGYETTTTFRRHYADGSALTGTSYTNTHFYLELWTLEEKKLDKWLKKKKKTDELPTELKIQLARIELYTDFESLSRPELLFDADVDGGGHIRNWGPGYLKGYVNSLMLLLDKGEAKTLFSKTLDLKELKKLKKATLYIPDYTLIKFNKWNGDETKRHEEKSLLGGYKYPYRLVSNEELNRLIMEATEPVYYLVYIKSSTDKYISVYNGQSGKLIYSVYSPISYNIKSKDLGKLLSEIQTK